MIITTSKKNGQQKSDGNNTNEVEDVSSLKVKTKQKKLDIQLNCAQTLVYEFT